VSPCALPGCPAAVYDVFAQTTADLERRIGTPEGEHLWTDPAFVAKYW